MTSLELLVEIAKGETEVFDMASRMIGKPELALLIAKAAVAGTSISLCSTRVGEVLGMTKQGAQKRIENTAVKGQ